MDERTLNPPTQFLLQVFEVVTDNTNYLAFLEQRKTRLARKHYSPEPSLFYDL